MNFSVVIPAFNEAPSLDELYCELTAVMDALSDKFEIIFVDDGSTDATRVTLEALAARDPRVISVRLSGRSGKAEAYARGFQVAKGELIATLDADLQDDPASLPKLIQAIDRGYDFVIASRRGRFQHEPGKTIASAAFNLAASLLVGPSLRDINCGFRLFRRAVLSALDLSAGQHRFLPAQAHRAGFRVTEVPVTHRPRKYGHSKYSYVRALPGLWGLVKMRARR